MFIGKLEEILDYLKRMEYEDINAASGDPLWRAISLEIRRDVAQELAHDKKLKKTKDGKALVPKLEQLKAYVEASLSVLDLEVGITKKANKIPEVKKESSNQSKTVDSSGKITSLEEEIKKLRTELNTCQNARAPSPHFRQPLGPGSQPFRSNPFPRAPLLIYYCKEKEHTSMFCPYLTEDLGKRLVYKSGQYYY
jgi:hypothetical protein